MIPHPVTMDALGTASQARREATSELYQLIKVGNGTPRTCAREATCYFLN